MKSYGRMLCLKNDPALIAAYKQFHQEVWPEIIAGMRAVGITKMKIYLRGTRLFMYVETEDGFDPAKDFARAQATVKGQEWSALMHPLQEKAPEAGADEWWASMEEVYDSNWPQYSK
ncbi:MAG: L-rhamnose mutarotase [Chloroflexota bacterium]